MLFVFFSVPLAPFILLIVLLFLCGVNYVESLLTNCAVGIIIFFGIIDVIACILSMFQCEKKSKIIKIIGFPIMAVMGIFTSIVSVLSFVLIFICYADQVFNHGLLNMIIMIPFALVFLPVMIIPVGVKIGTWTMLIAFDEEDFGIKIGLYTKIGLYILVCIIGIMINTAISYFFDMNTFLNEFHNDFIENTYQFFCNINPINWLIDMIKN